MKNRIHSIFAILMAVMLSFRCSNGKDVYEKVTV